MGLGIIFRCHAGQILATTTHFLPHSYSTQVYVVYKDSAYNCQNEFSNILLLVD